MYVSKNRPLAPHLTIYKMQNTSLISILQRISGALLFLFLFVVFHGFLFLVPRMLFEYNVTPGLLICYNFYFYFIISLGFFITFAIIYHLIKGMFCLFLDIKNAKL